MTAKELIKLKEGIEELQRKEDRMEGRIEEMTESLKKQFKIESVEDTDKLLAKKIKERDRLKKEAEKMKLEFEETFGEDLG